MGEEHLTAIQIERYRRRVMAPADLLAADSHLACCSHCREAAAQAAGGPADIDSLRAGLRNGDAVHLAYGRLAAFVDGTLDDVEREIVESHLAVCGECRVDWLDLDLFSKSLAAPPRHDAVGAPLSSWWSRVRQAGLGFSWTPVRAAAAIACLVFVIWVGSIPFRGGPDVFRRQTVQVGSPAPGVPVETRPGGTEQQDIGSRTVELIDGGGKVVLYSTGLLTGVPADSSGLSDAVRLVLEGQPLTVPTDVAGLAGRTGVLMGKDQPQPPFGQLSPVGTAVIADRPTLRWQALTGATRYEVSVYDGDFTPVAVSPPLDRTEWTVPRKLKRGAVFSWQVKAFRDGEEILFPKPPAPEARFKVLDASQAGELESAQRNHVSSHLLLGILSARVGALDDAEREFKALAEANPQSPIPQRFLRELSAVRRH